ncbi:MAG TPA: MFS transporter [Nitrososphaerales archaeon]|nr:MFS transporter [Nitrososphaerales archaeon]
MSSPAPLTKDPDFLKFWVGQSISVLGSQFSPLAIGTIAVISLKASGFQLGLLGFLNTISFLTLGLLVGVWVDRHRRRRIMIIADFGRSLTLVAIPLAAVFFGLTMNLLYVVTLIAGVLTLFFEISYQAYVPSLVDKPKIVEANSRLEATRTLGQGAGPAAAGAAITLISAPLAVLGDTLGYLASSFSLLWIRRAEDPPNTARRESVAHDIREGLSLVIRDPRLRAIAAATGTSNLFGNAYGVILVKYAYVTLGMSPLEFGVSLGSSAAGGVIGALTATRIAKSLGVGKAIITGASLYSFVIIFLYFATPATAFVTFVAVQFVSTIGVIVYNVVQVSYRQSLVPRDIQGRMNATMRTIVWGTIPVGSLLGGFFADAYGIRETVGVMTVLACLAVFWLVISPVRKVREFPTD